MNETTVRPRLARAARSAVESRCVNCAMPTTPYAWACAAPRNAEVVAGESVSAPVRSRTTMESSSRPGVGSPAAGAAMAAVRAATSIVRRTTARTADTHCAGRSCMRPPGRMQPEQTCTTRRLAPESPLASDVLRHEQLDARDVSRRERRVDRRQLLAEPHLERLRHVGHLTADRRRALHLLVVRTAFVVHDAAVQLHEVLAQPLLTGDRATFLGRDDRLAHHVHGVARVAEPERE